MIEYLSHTLPCGLRIVVNRDSSSRMAAVNVLYGVGARDESPRRTGLAHLFEHLMFSGTRDVPDFDAPVQWASGENNAFTNNDYTDYYMTLPRENIETAFWLESDRMAGLQLTRAKLEAEKQVVIEEYNQRYLTPPYGDHALLVRSLVYRRHPYRWATIGRDPRQIEHTTLGEVEAFRRRWIHPSNAVLSVSADMDPRRVIRMAARWFDPIPSPPVSRPTLPIEPAQHRARRLEVRRDVPAASLTIAFPMGGRLSPSYYRLDMVSDLLAGGDTGRLYRRLVQERGLFGQVNAYITGDRDPGIFLLTGHLQPGTTIEEAEKAFWEELQRLQHEPVTDQELERVKNKFEAATLFGELNVMNKAMNLGYYTWLGDTALVNREVGFYRALTARDLQQECRFTFRPFRSSTLIYRPADA